MVCLPDDDRQSFGRPARQCTGELSSEQFGGWPRTESKPGVHHIDGKAALFTRDSPANVGKPGEDHFECYAEFLN